jgi:hypothetical protein
MPAVSQLWVGLGSSAADWTREQAAYVFGTYGYAYGFPLVMMDVTGR